jgi:purine-binding chemotaxis protein CheW
MSATARATAAAAAGVTVRPSAPTAAGSSVAATPTEGGAQIVTFRIGRDLFAADVRAVERVLRHQTPTPVPNVPEWVSGVLEYLKRVVPVIDMRARFEAPTDAPTNETRVLIFNVAGSWVGGVVDAVLDVTAVDRGQVEPSPALFRGFAAQYMNGIVRREGKLVILLDVERLLTATERVALDRISESAGPTPPAAHA